jgi:ABC-type Fe3+/spermidine/putrescine transport system ATPase subunit
MAESFLRLRDVSKRYGKVHAVEALSLDIRAGEIFALLGPSGCGKTTTLRIIAGLEVPDAGEVYYRNRFLVSVPRDQFVPSERRRLGMVFQSYAIWPHMTVFENVAYPLRLRGVRGEPLHDKVRRTLEVVGLGGLESRPAPLLSGGQQQRVALARALVYEPEILLLDEPLSNLDARLREQMRVELKLLQRQLGITMIVVTHDQVEALSLSDRLAVMNQGRVEQLGTPRELYERPATSFVRDFLGKCAVLRGRVVEWAGAVGRVELPAVGGELVYDRRTAPAEAVAGTAVFVSVRPEEVVVAEEPGRDDQNVLKGIVETLLFTGDRTECRVRVGSEHVTVYVPPGGRLEQGQSVFLHFPAGALRIWPSSET